LFEKNSLYAQIIHIAMPTIIIIGVITFIILLKTKLLILSHHQINEFGSAASRLFLMGSIALSIEESNLHILLTQNEKVSEFDSSELLSSSVVKDQLKAQPSFTKHFISTVLWV
jgi:hypothetical protein